MAAKEKINLLEVIPCRSEHITCLLYTSDAADE